MTEKERGFTLIELLIVIATIGILVALLLFNVTMAIQKTKQKQTMMDIVSIGTACTGYITDHGTAPDSGNQSGPVESDSDFRRALSPFYLKVFPTSDQWGGTFLAYSGEAVGSVYSIPAEDVGDDDFLIVSWGRDRRDGGSLSFSYDPSNPDAGLYTLNSIDDFNNDLINLNGTWIHAPRILASGT